MTNVKAQMTKEFQMFKTCFGTCHWLFEFFLSLKKYASFSR